MPTATARRNALPLHALLAAGACLLPTRAFAFKFFSPVSDGCHEMISAEAVQHVGWPDALAPTPLSHDERLIARDLPFDIAGTKTDSWMLALSIGVRFNDLHGLAAGDLPGLSTLHNDPKTQQEHCLRTSSDDGMAGDLSALRGCERFIYERIDAALGDESDATIDLDARTSVDVALAFQGTTRVSINRYGFELGRALHALQDSFSHTFRSPDGARVRHVLNFVDWADDDHNDAARDGYQHLDGLDLCRGTDARWHRRNLAVQASEEFLAALNDETLTREQRRDNARAVVSRWLDYEPGCTTDNNWCDAPERKEPEPGCAVAADDSSGFKHAGSLWPMLWVIWTLRRRRQQARHLLTVAALLLCLNVQSQASAQDIDVALNDRATTASPWGIAALGAVAIDEGAFATRLGGRLRASQQIEFGLEGEFNPWFSLETQRVVPGSFNAFGTFIYDWFSAGAITLRSSAHLGVSVLLFDLLGAPSGSWGPLVGVNFLGVSVDVGQHWRLLIEPAEVMLPIVQLSPIPFYYRQYRFAIGVQFNP